MTNRPAQKPVAAIWDLDGTLLDTEPIYFKAYAETMAHLGLGKPYTFEEHHIHLLGRAELEGANRCIAWLGNKLTAQEFIEDRDKFLLGAMKTVKPCQGAMEAIAALKEAGMKLAIATSSDRELIAVKTNPHTTAIFDSFPTLISATDPVMNGKRGKPDPAIYLCAAEALGVDPKRCIAIEDSISGMLSAKAAGMFTIGVPDPRLEKETLEDLQRSGKGPDVLLWGGLSDFKTDLFL